MLSVPVRHPHANDEPDVALAASRIAADGDDVPGVHAASSKSLVAFGGCHDHRHFAGNPLYVLSEAEIELLRECCRLLDECESLPGTVDADGTTVAGSAGQPRVHPALGELRQHRLASAAGVGLVAGIAPGREFGCTSAPTGGAWWQSRNVLI